MNIDLKALGINEEEIQDRVVNQICKQIMSVSDFDEDGIEYFEQSKFGKKLAKFVQKHVDDTVSALAEKYVLPNVGNYVESLSLQETNKWGEKTGKPVTFIEYLIARAEKYLTEPVSFDGKTKDQDSYNWKGTQTRISYLVNSHLQYSIETAMKEAIKNANAVIVKGLEETVKIKLQEVSNSLKVAVTPK